MNFSLWSFRFLLWYVCILLVQPQNRFTFLWPLHIADVSFILAIVLHLLACLEERRPIVRMGPATILTLLLMVATLMSQFFGIYQIHTGWSSTTDYIMKNAALLLMVEAVAITAQRVMATQLVVLFATLWWVKGGLRLSALGATAYGDRLMGAAVSMIENPNGFAYMMCVFLPLYLWAYQQAPRKWVKVFFLACALAAVWIVFETGSRTGLVTLMAIGAILLPYYGRHHFRALAVIAVVLYFLFPLTGEKNIARFRTIPQAIASFVGLADAREDGDLTQDEQSTEERKQKNADSWGLIKENIVFGVGVNADPEKFANRFPMARGEVHCEILRAGVIMGIVGMGLYVGFIAILFGCGNWCRTHADGWATLHDLGWTFQIQAVAIAIGGAFCPQPWHSPMMLLAGSASALYCNLKAERAATRKGAR